jgi:hypothetical protein
VSEAGRPAQAGAPAAPPVWLSGLHLLALWSFALVQPLFDLLGRNADFFVARGSPSGDIVAFAFAVTLLPPLLLFGIEALAGLVSPAARRITHLVLVGLLVALVAMGLLRKLEASSGLLLPVAVAIGAGGALWYAREKTVRSFVSVLVAAPPLFLALFLLSSPVHKLVITGEASADVRDLRSNVPVVMVAFDEFPVASLMGPDERVDAVRYPNLARFARDATWFRNTTTVADGTRWATPIVVSGQLPRKDALPTFSDYPQNLFTVLGGGYRLHVTEPVTRLCPRNLCADTGPRESEEGEVAGVAPPDQADDSFGERMGSLAEDLGIVSLHLVLPDDLRGRLPSVSETLGDFGGGGGNQQAAARRDSRAQRELRRATGRRLTELIPEAKRAERTSPAFPRFLRQIRPWSGRGDPPLYFLHVLLPHHPWRLLPSGREYGDSRPRLPGLRDNVWNGDTAAVDQGWQRHLLQVGFTDRALGRLMARLRATGLYDRALVVLASDHGAHFAPSAPRRKVTREGVAGIAAVPFFVKLPGQRRGRVVDEHVQTIDILPTIADALDVRLPRESDGRSALSADFAGRTQVSVWSTTSTREFERVDFPLGEVLRRRRELIARQALLFGTGSSSRLWSAGPRPDLFGRPVAQLARTPARRASARLDRPEDYRAVDPRSAYSPSHVSGVVEGVPAGREVAAAVNGRIEAVGRTYTFAGRTRFSLMVAERAFREGPNQVAVYALDTRGGSVRLTLLEG